MASDNALSSSVSPGTSISLSILAFDASSSKNAAKLSRPSSSFKRAYASACMLSKSANARDIACISGFGNQIDTLVDQ